MSKSVIDDFEERYILAILELFQLDEIGRSSKSETLRI
jgi:hypothetical protein